MTRRFFKIAAVLLLVGGAALLWWQWHGIAGNEITDGTIDDIHTVVEDRGGARSEKTRTTTVSASFRDRDGERRRIRWGVLISMHAVGDRIRILHAPGRPFDGVPFSASTYFGWGWWIMGAGVFGMWIWLGGTLGNRVLRWLRPSGRSHGTVIR